MKRFGKIANVRPKQLLQAGFGTVGMILIAGLAVGYIYRTYNKKRYIYIKGDDSINIE